MYELMNITVGDLLELQAKNFPDQNGVLYTDCDFRMTYSEFNEYCDKIAKGLMGLGVKKGDHVAIWATNCPEWITLLFAAAKIGAILVTVNTNYKVFELEYILKQSDSMTLVLIDGFKDANYIEIVKEVCPMISSSKPGELNSPKLPFLKNVILAGGGKEEGFLQWEELVKIGEKISDDELERAKRSLDPQDVINMQYTSGTTGFPKGVMLTHYNIVNNGKSIGDCMNFSEKDTLCIPVPFFHCFGLVLAIMAAVTHATTMVPIRHYSPIPVMRAIQNEKCTAVHGVPTMYIAMLEHPEFKNFDFSSLRTGIMAGSPCPIKVMQDVVDKMGMKEITISFGQTEASPVCTMTTIHDSLEQRVSTVGKALPHIECKIVDPETGVDLPPNTQGEFVARGYNIMRGYYKMEEATKQAIDKDGWLHSGDICMMDENGYFKVTGRLKDMIIRGGENIYPKEIEEFLYTHEQVSDVQVIGVPSEQYGEEVCACVVLKEGAQTTQEELAAYVKANMARHKVPKYFWFMPEFPMTASGKIQKFKLREMAVKHFNLEKDAAIETA